MWGSDYPQSGSTFAQSKKFWRSSWRVPDDEPANPARDPDPGIAALHTTRAAVRSVGDINYWLRNASRLHPVGPGALLWLARSIA